MTLSYFNIQKFSLHDGPGIRTNVFLKGCPLRCLWCHNPESQNTFPELMFKSDKCTSCGRCLDMCGARFRGENGRVIFDREKCTVCGKCVDVCPNYVNSVCGKIGMVDEIVAEVVKDKMFYENSGGGMTVCAPARFSQSPRRSLRSCGNNAVSQPRSRQEQKSRTRDRRRHPEGTRFLR